MPAWKRREHGIGPGGRASFVATSPLSGALRGHLSLFDDALLLLLSIESIDNRELESEASLESSLLSRAGRMLLLVTDASNGDSLEGGESNLIITLSKGFIFVSRTSGWFLEAAAPAMGPTTTLLSTLLLPDSLGTGIPSPLALPSPLLDAGYFVSTLLVLSKGVCPQSSQPLDEVWLLLVGPT